MEPEGITLFTDIGVVSVQQPFGRLRVQSQGISQHNSCHLEAEVSGGLVSSEAQARPRSKFQKPRPLPDPEKEEPFGVGKDPSEHSPGLAQVARLPRRGDSLMEVPLEESRIEEIGPGQLWRRASVADFSRRDCPDELDPSAFSIRRSKSIRIPSSSKGSFQPKRNKSINSKFSAVKFQEDEIWVETFGLNDEGKMEYFFKGLKGQECLEEPPTGAVNVIYLEDVLAGQRDEHAAVNNIKREMSTPSMMKKGKKKSKWASFLQRYRSSRKGVSYRGLSSN